MQKERPVKVYYDESIAKKYQKKKKEQKKLTKEELKEQKRLEKEEQRAISRNSLRQMGFSSAMDKDERKFRLLSAIRKKEVQTVQASATYMSLSENTIRNYLREMNIGIYDAKIDNYTRWNEDTEIYEFDFDAI